MKALVPFLIFFCISCNYNGGQNSIEIDAIPNQPINGWGINDGGGCTWSETEAASQKNIYVLEEEMDSTVHHALVCINKVPTILNYDTIHTIKKSDTISESIAYYSNDSYELVNDIFDKFENGNWVNITATMTVKEKKTGKVVTKKDLYGVCGAI